MGKKRIVVKVGTSSLTAPDGSVSSEKIERITSEIASLRELGYEVILVSSGAIAAGFRRLGYAERPTAIAAKQASAAVGQSLLMEEYTRRLMERDIVTAQILLTREDFRDARRYRNAFAALDLLLKRSAVPIINENDTVAIDEIKLGDNDTLSAQVAAMVHAELLVLLTDQDGLYTADPRTDETAARIERVERITGEILMMGGSAGTRNATGGMLSKLYAAKLATSAGVGVVITAATTERVLTRLLHGESLGTYFVARKTGMRTRRQWMAFYATPAGNLYIDEGAAEAMVHQGGSLLPSGIVMAEGDFRRGDIVRVFLRGTGEPIGCGRVNFSKGELLSVIGLQSDAVFAKLGVKRAEAIHRNDWVAYITQPDQNGQTL